MNVLANMVRYSIILHKNREVPGYSVVVPELPGCFSQGFTRPQSIANAKEAIECHLAGTPQEGQPFMVARVRLGAGSVKSTTLTMYGKQYRLTRKEVIAGARGVTQAPYNGKRRWYVVVEESELPARWFMMQLKGLGTADVRDYACTKGFFDLGFELVYKGAKEPELWINVLGLR